MVKKKKRDVKRHLEFCRVLLANQHQTCAVGVACCPHQHRQLFNMLTTCGYCFTSYKIYHVRCPSQGMCSLVQRTASHCQCRKQLKNLCIHLCFVIFWIQWTFCSEFIDKLFLWGEKTFFRRVQQSGVRHKVRQVCQTLLKTLTSEVQDYWRCIKKEASKEDLHVRQTPASRNNEIANHCQGQYHEKTLQ